MNEEKVREKLKEVVDPEIGYNIVDLGLVYDIKIKGKKAKVLLTLTTPMCPVGGLIMSESERVIRELGLEPEIDLTFDPPWSPEKMSEEIRRRLGI